MDRIIDMIIQASELSKSTYRISNRYLDKALAIVKPLPRGQSKYALKISQSILENENFRCFA